MSSAIDTMVGKTTRAAWNTWLVAADNFKHQTLLMFRALSGLRSRLLWGFNAWCSAMEPSDDAIARALATRTHARSRRHSKGRTPYNIRGGNFS